ncbi:MAG: hypothetical protein JOZ96_26530 [Acidobacteria bacterium]|nr:hypothetical protein [Acidobacteriota bacterium]
MKCPNQLKLLGVACLLVSAHALLPPAARAQTRWQLDADGRIRWEVEQGKAHQDHVEMSGRKVSVIVTYGVDERGGLILGRQVVFPMLRFAPNKTRDHFSLAFGDDSTPRVLVDRAAPRADVVKAFGQRGLLRVESLLGRDGEVALTRTIFPSVDKPLVVEKLTFTNRSDRDLTVEVEDTERVVRTSAARGVYGAYVASSRVADPGERVVRPRESTTFALLFSARKISEPPLNVDVEAEERARAGRVAEILSRLRLETPDPVLDAAFAFAKIRAAESIFETKGGLMHGPGGGAYYAAVWANDQAEYANPFFAYLGDATAAESAVNSFRHFARYVNPDYRPIPSSIISEGADFWHGAKDRGDMAMIAYGAARFALAYGRRETAEQLWPLVEWCLEYCRRKLDERGVVASDSDELENRFPAGRANLNTSSLYYDALNSAAMLGRELGKPSEQLARYETQAGALRAAIEKHFGANVEGFETYRYYDRRDLAGHAKFGAYAGRPDVLRAWIATPLTVGLYERREGTVAALFSQRLWTEDGLATEDGDKTFWDRSTLYGLRGAFAAGATEKALAYLTSYSKRRLLGEHVPYAVEAYPEGNQRHLSAESALYCRVYTEGMFGLRPTGFGSFQLTPRLPEGWGFMRLKNVRAFGGTFDLNISRVGDKLKVEVLAEGKPPQSHLVKQGETLTIKLEGER